MKERIIFYILKSCSKEEQLRIITEMIFQLLPERHLHLNPKGKILKHVPPLGKLWNGTSVIEGNIAGVFDKEQVMGQFDKMVDNLKVKHGK